MRVCGLWLVLLLGGCPKGTGATPPTRVVHPDAERPDPHSFGRADEVRATHLDLDLAVDFARRELHGTARLRIERTDPDAPLWLDTRDLVIERVEVGGEPWVPAEFALQKPDPILGRALRVTLTDGATAVRVAYRTAATASGLQWLEPAQTADGTDPFLYSQSQAIHARSWIPCQDSPGVRVTYDARIRVAPPLRALMAADAVPSDDGFRFKMEHPIPAYLIALAVGRVQFLELGRRSGVWAEPSVLGRAAHEFADVEQMLDTAEQLYGPYRWGRYDILVLPPAFPFGGMENPRLTFATPTILAGDRSLVALIAHELAHSWSGNLVTNATWNDLWLNEGFTVYIERRIVEALYGVERAQMEAALGRQDLEEELAGLDPEDQRLRVDLRGRDPDDGMSDVPYEKGALFLQLLEQTYGRDVFDDFLRRWFERNAFGSATTAQFEAFLRTELLARAQPRTGRSPPDVAAWVDAPGVGPNAPVPRSAALERVDASVAAFAAGTVPANDLPTRRWSPHEWLHFLRALPQDVDAARLAALDEAHALTSSGNAEILAQWLELGVRRGYAAVDVRLEAFLRDVGRRKFLTPLYRALLESDRSEDARRIYGLARPGYHPITQRTLDGIVQSK